MSERGQGTDRRKGVVITETRIYPADHSGGIGGGSVKDHTGADMRQERDKRTIPYIELPTKSKQN